MSSSTRRGRVGLVAVTYEHLTLHQATLFPGPGVTSQLELGIRGDYLFLAGYAEIFTWADPERHVGWCSRIHFCSRWA